ncbi:DUF2085 domain-containing protein [Clostridium autoethanogenum]|uniref:DUF2085 domain-containing protein n=1 Tax=Clostridium autoethanogenum TaxID=84023 RepID=A0A3M0SV96_9CLOT|nr:DUF2085 domain-containing protein [Clostridium autoethanogenum]RMD02317.1 DUF2085 domain-containing protein [Clostridium autoethanogenum]
MKIMYKVKNNLGKVPLCNGRPERAPYIFGRCFFLCWRCTMVMVFSIISTIAMQYIDVSLAMSGTFRIIGVILMIPMIFDGSIQYFLKKDSTNVRRAITGSLFGIGVTIIEFQLT